MKKMTFMACAAMLASTVAFTGCKSNDPVGPNLNGEDVVKTEFAISLPEQASNGAKHMPSANVPEDGTFAGMKNITLIPFAETGAIVSGNTRLGLANITLDPITSGLTTTGNAKLYSDVAIPLGTGSFLFYAEATAAAAAEGTSAAKHEGGILTATAVSAGAPADIHFDLEKILGTTTLAQIYTDTKAVNLLALLNNVANAVDGRTPTPKAFKNYEAGDDAGMVELATSYKTMHALSSFEVFRVLTDLYKTVEPYKTGKPGAAEPVASLADNIQAAIAAQITVTRDGEGNITNFAWTTSANYDNYPTNLGLPQGAVRIKYDSESTKTFVTCIASDYTTQANPELFVYPASLWYYANSTIKAANASMSGQYVDGKSWETIIAAYTAASAAATVSAMTQSVAIVNPIQYAVGRFDMQVKLNATTLKDQANLDVTMPEGGFPVTAVFIGNQRQVLFNFTPTTDGGATKYTIYDNELANIKVTNTTFTTANSTFVLETPASVATEEPYTDANADVKIALELENTSTRDFTGVNGQLIPKGGKFYLVATLNAYAAATETGKKVFKQDYKTTAQLTIKSLANAYNEIPDLRTPQLELGMSVNLTWEAGHAYEINIE